MFFNSVNVNDYNVRRNGYKCLIIFHWIQSTFIVILTQRSGLSRFLLLVGWLLIVYRLASQSWRAWIMWVPLSLTISVSVSSCHPHSSGRFGASNVKGFVCGLRHAIKIKLGESQPFMFTIWLLVVFEFGNNAIIKNCAFSESYTLIGL